MTWWLWLVAVVLGIAFFGLGAFTSWVWRTRPDIARPELGLGVFFTILALIVVADTVQLQVRLNGYIQEAKTREDARCSCDQRQTDVLVKLSVARRNVDITALAYDQAVVAYLSVPVSNRESNDPVVTHVRKTLDDLVQARKDSEQVFMDNPMPTCP